jgi:hypothetical protein
MHSGQRHRDEGRDKDRGDDPIPSVLKTARGEAQNEGRGLGIKGRGREMVENGWKRTDANGRKDKVGKQ